MNSRLHEELSPRVDDIGLGCVRRLSIHYPPPNQRLPSPANRAKVATNTLQASLGVGNEKRTLLIRSRDESMKSNERYLCSSFPEMTTQHLSPETALDNQTNVTAYINHGWQKHPNHHF